MDVDNLATDGGGVMLRFPPTPISPSSPSLIEAACDSCAPWPGRRARHRFTPSHTSGPGHVDVTIPPPNTETPTIRNDRATDCRARDVARRPGPNARCHARPRSLPRGGSPLLKPSWRAAVLDAVVVLDDATDQEYTNAVSPDSLLSDIKRSQPRLRTRVRGLRTQYEHLRQAITSIRAELAVSDDGNTDYADLRPPGCSPHSGTNVPASPT